jgi:hypothetical protein
MDLLNVNFSLGRRVLRQSRCANLMYSANANIREILKNKNLNKILKYKKIFETLLYFSISASDYVDIVGFLCSVK